MKLLTFSCGCVGFRTGETIIALWDCCGDEDLSFIDRSASLSEKSSEPLGAEATAMYIERLRHAVEDSKRLRQLQMAFRVAGITLDTNGGPK